MKNIHFYTITISINEKSTVKTSTLIDGHFSLLSDTIVSFISTNTHLVVICDTAVRCGGCDFWCGSSKMTRRHDARLSHT